MIGSLYIDGVDVYSEYGVFIAEGGYNELVCYAPTKNVAANNWYEHDGQQVDFASVALNSRELSIKFASHNRYDIGGFMEMLSAKVYHKFEFMQLEREYILRLESQPNLAMHSRFGALTLRFADDFPAKNGPIIDPRSNENRNMEGYEINQVDLSKYGVRVLEGTLDEIHKAPTVKKGMLQNLGFEGGDVCRSRSAIVAYEPKDVKIRCLMRADTLDEFWHNYDALLNNLIQPKERSLYVDKTGYEYPCYYKSCDVSEFRFSGRIWFRFDLTLTFTSFRAGGDEYLLASQADQWVVSEKDEAIDLNNYFNR